MRIYDIIKKKREHQELSKEEIKAFVEGYTDGTVKDYHAAALAMAIYLNGMTGDETIALTDAMMHSGDVIDLSEITGIKVDKHSTGGVGDTTTLVLAPLVATLGVPIAKMSGRGLGHTGGTIDKLESIPGFHVELTSEQFVDQVKNTGVAVMGQTKNIAPADKKLYALRDVTATVENISLIASSIMSKKLAAGSDGIVLDVKTGSGAFIKTVDGSIELANAMVGIGNGMGRETIALITDMSQPLGFAIGNSLEVIEAIETLKGNGPKDLTDLCLQLGANMAIIGNKDLTYDDAYRMLEENITNGKAIDKFKAFIKAQGGDISIVDDYTKLPNAKHVIQVKSPVAGTVKSFKNEAIGVCAMMLGAGRASITDEIDYSAGIVLNKKIGDKVAVDEVLATLYTNEDATEAVTEKFLESIEIVTQDVTSPKLVIAKIDSLGTTLY